MADEEFSEVLRQAAGLSDDDITERSRDAAGLSDDDVGSSVFGGARKGSPKQHVADDANVPTLLVPGSLRGSHQKELDKIVPLTYITDYFERRLVDPPKTFADRILLLTSKTASGKSTTFVIGLYRAFHKKYGKNVVVTEPTVLVAIDNAKRIASSPWFPEMKLGENIGFQTRPFTHKPVSGVIIMSTGVLLQQLKNNTDDWICTHYQFIIIDETHRKTLDLDLAFVMLRDLLLRNMGKRECPFVVFMSATFDVVPYMNFFSLTDDNHILVEGVSKPITTHYLKEPSMNYLRDMASTIYRIHTENQNDDPKLADILVFLPGNGEITRLRQMITELFAGGAHGSGGTSVPVLKVLSIDSAAISKSSPDYQMIDVPANELTVMVGDQKKKPIRKVILSTEVAETGVTLPYLKYVVDSCWARMSFYVNEYGMLALATVPISVASSIQRRGRVGRSAPGEYWPMCTKATYDKLQLLRESDIMRYDVSDLSLSIIASEAEAGADDGNGLGVIPDIIARCQNAGDNDVPKRGGGKRAATQVPPLMEVPSTSSFVSAAFKLDELGFVKNGVITEIGKIAAKFTMMLFQASGWFGVRFALSAALRGLPLSDVATMIAFSETKVKWRTARYSFTDEIELLAWGLQPHTPAGFQGGTTKAAGAPPGGMKLKFLICDDLIESVFIYDAITKGIFEHGPAFCVKHNIDYDSLLDVFAAREDIICMFINIGLDPFKGIRLMDVASNVNMLMERVVALKRCIFEGFHLFTVVWNTEAQPPRYVLASDMKTPVKIKKAWWSNPEFARELLELGFAPTSRPKHVVCTQIRFAEVPPSTVLVCQGSGISIMDGYVPIRTDLGCRGWGSTQGPAVGSAAVGAYYDILAMDASRPIAMVNKLGTPVKFLGDKIISVAYRQEPVNAATAITADTTAKTILRVNVRGAAEASDGMPNVPPN